MSEFPQVKAHWDAQEGAAEGWYVQVVDENGNVVDDSEKIGFEVDADEFTRSEEKALAEALGAAFPEHEIYVEQQ